MVKREDLVGGSDGYTWGMDERRSEETDFKGMQGNFVEQYTCMEA